MHESTGEEMLSPPSRGTRELRRQATAHAIERIAVDLALELGSANVTVEMICERGLIAHRTFYNYFPTKDAALIGNGPPSASDERVDAFRTGTSEDVFADLVDLLASPLLETENEHGFVVGRRLLMQREPELLEKSMARFGEFLNELTELVLERLGRMGRTPEETPDLREEAEMIVTLAGAVMQRAAHQLFREGDDEDAKAILRRAVDLARRVQSKGPR